MRPRICMYCHVQHLYKAIFYLFRKKHKVYRAHEYFDFISTNQRIPYVFSEYGQNVHASTCGDVYSFGVVILEMLLGKRPTDSMFGDDLSIVSFAESNFPDNILGKIDARIQEECKGSIKTKPEAEKEIYQCLQSLVQVALSCTRLFPRERMNMREVAINLHAIRRSYVAATKRQ